MKVRFVGVVVVCAAIILTISFPASNTGESQTKKVSPASGLSQIEQDLLNEINQARAHPQLYASYLEKLKPLFNGKEYKVSAEGVITTQEGWSAVEDAIKFLRSATPQGPLSTAQGLSLAALTHCKDQGVTGNTGHKGSDSAFIEQRVKPFGTWQGGIGENISYGNDSARERLLTWLIDDGFPSRGHRTRLMSGNYKVAGLSCGPHPEWGTMCVLELAGGFMNSAAAKPAPSNQTKSSGTLKNRPPSATISASAQTQSSASGNNNSTAAKPSESSGADSTNKSKTTSKPRSF
jgi:uncharacterized protein YkwD